MLEFRDLFIFGIMWLIMLSSVTSLQGSLQRIEMTIDHHGQVIRDKMYVLGRKIDRADSVPVPSFEEKYGAAE
jgi:hypothetical protein